MHLRMPQFRLTRRVGKILLTIVVIALLLCALAAWQVPRVLRSVLTQDVAHLIGRDVSVGKITFNPFTLTVRAHDLGVAQPGSDTPLLSMAQMDASVAWSSLFWFAPVIDAVALREPKIALTREDVTRFNFSDIQQRFAQQAAAAPPEPPKADTGLPRFSLNNMVLEGGSITLDDKVTGRHQVIDDIGIGIPFISTFGYATDIDVQPRVHLRINGSEFDVNGVARPFDVVPKSTLNIAFSGLALDKWADVWPMPLPFKLQRALLDSNLEVVFEQPKGAAPKILVTGDLGMRQFDLRDNTGASLAAWSALTVNRIEFEPMERQLYIGEIGLWAPQVQVRRYANQHLNWQDVADKLKQLGAPPASVTPPKSTDQKGGAAVATIPGTLPTSSAAEVAPREAAGATTPSPVPPAPTPTPAAPASPAAAPEAQPPGTWHVALDAFNVHDAELQVNDDVSKLDYTLSGVAATVEGVEFPQPKDRPIDLWLTVDNSTDGGWIRAKGPLVLQPLSLELGVSMGNVALAPFAPVIRSASPVDVLDGRLGLRGQIHVQEKNAAVDVSATGVKLDLTGLHARDESLKPAVDVVLEALHLTADRLAMGPGVSAFTVQATGIQRQGTLAMQGTFTPTPLTLKTSVDLSGLDVASFAPLVASSLNATVRSIIIGAKGQAAFAAAAGATPMKASWNGAVQVSDVDLQDRVNRDDFLNWRSLNLDGMAITLAGSKIAAHLGDITLDDFYGRILLSAQGRLNVMDLVAAPGQAGGSITQDTQTPGRQVNAPVVAAPASPMPEISVNSVTLKRGRMTFTDRFVKPNYVAELSSIEGSVSAVSSVNPQPAKVNVTGRVYTSAPLSISGTVQPFAKYLALNLKVSAKNVDLPRFTTYSAKYVGYPIKRGKLSVDLEYKIKDRALQASNHVVLNQLTFGAKTNSPDATKLPVMLAVALLKDARGNIDINLPISGSLDDPEFSVGGIVVRVLMNLVVKAVTSPFSLLASAFGGGDELAFVEFAPGSAVLTEDSQSRIATLIKALTDRPALKMDISGRADPASDIDGLRQAWVDLKIREAKAGATAGRGKKPDLSGVQVSAAEREKYLEQVYDDTKIKDKPRNLIGMAKSLPAAEMEALLRQAAPIGDEQLRQLADARAQAVYEKLQAQPGLADRVFIVAPQLDADGIKDEGKPSRVDFSLQ